MTEPTTHPHLARRLLLVLAIAAVLLAALGIASRVRKRAALTETTLAAAVPIVTVVQPVAGDPATEIVLPGNVEAFTDAPIYARTNGYVSAWHADIGTFVAKGQKLADIESPEVDQQLQQARADLQTAAANEQLARVTASRLSNLVESQAISRQEYDNAVSALAARRAETASAKANVGRLEQLVSFEQILAPFAGTITARNTDVGQLVDAGSAGGPGRELFRIASTNRLRVFIEVPQVDSAAATDGLPAELTLAERPGKRYPGTIARTAGAIAPGTRTLRVEVDIENPNGEILPGAYAQVHLKLRNAAPALLVPVSALLFRAEGPRIATLQGGRAVLLPVALGRDYGTQIEVTSGLAPDASIIDSPPDSLLDGQEVRVAQKPPPPRSPSPSS